MTTRAGEQQVERSRRLHQQGVAQNHAGRPARALPLLRDALDLLTEDGRIVDDRLAARIWISIATSESELGGLARGLAALDEASRFVATAADAGLQALYDNQLGFMLVRGGRVADGLRYLDAAVDGIEHADPATHYSILLNRGTTHLFQGNLRAARDDLTRAITTAQAEQMAAAEVKAQHNLGYLEFLAGNLASALRIMDEVLQIDADVSPAVILLDRARVLIEAGLHRDADHALRSAGELFRADRLFKDVGDVELARAECALLDGQIAAARRLAGKARDRFRSRSNDRWRRDAELLLLHADLAAGRPGARLAPAALRLAAEFRAELLETQARTAQLIAAEALLRAGRVSEAAGVASEGGVIRANDSISARLHTRLVRGRLHSAGGDLAAARREIRTGLNELARHQARFGSIDVQTAGAVHGRALAELHVGLALREGKPRGVLAAVELGRAASTRVQPVVAPTDAGVADQLAELRKLSEDLRHRSSDPSAVTAVQGLRRKIAEIQQTLRSQSWHLQGSGQAERTASVEEILAGLAGAGAIGITYLASGGQLHALVAVDGRLQLVPLGPSAPIFELVRRVRADLDMVARGNLIEAIADAVRRSLASSLQQLDRLLVGPLNLPGGRLVLSPTGPLAVLPWGLLPSLRGCPVVVGYSGTAWLRAAAGPGRPGGRVLAIAGPGLAHAEAEAKTVAQYWPAGDQLTGPAADQAAVKAALAEANVLHLAAHGTHQPENPLFSSIRLADGPLFAYELDETSRPAEHVVLAACELGQATIRPGDEPLGLTSVLLHLGTRSVISGIAKVHDQVAAEVMVGYHRALSRGVDSAQALADACADSGPLPAPFVCFGSAWRAESSLG